MTPQPDKLFRDRLEHFQKSAPDSAWDKIESGLRRRPARSVWWKVAASICLLFALSILFWPEGSPPDTIAIQSPPYTPNEESVALSDSNAVQPEMKVSLHASDPKRRYQETESIPIVRKVDPDLVQPVVPQTSIPELKHIEIASVQDEGAEKYTAAEPLVETISPMPEVVSTRLYYSANEVHARFLKKTVEIHATPDEKSASTIQKLVDLAMDIKNDDNLYGDLRQKKDEILALNFKSGKQYDNR